MLARNQGSYQTTIAIKVASLGLLLDKKFYVFSNTA